MPSTSKHVLCVDDDPETIELIRGVIQRINPSPQMSVVADAAAAVNMIAERSFELFLIVYRPDKRCGLELCRWIRKWDEWTPIIIFAVFSSKTVEATRSRGRGRRRRWRSMPERANIW